MERIFFYLKISCPRPSLPPPVLRCQCTRRRGAHTHTKTLHVWPAWTAGVRTGECVCVCVCVCARARACASVCVLSCSLTGYNVKKPPLVAPSAPTLWVFLSLVQIKRHVRT